MTQPTLVNSDPVGRNNKNIFRRFWWIGVLIMILIAIIVVVVIFKNSEAGKANQTNQVTPTESVLDSSNKSDQKPSSVVDKNAIHTEGMDEAQNSSLPSCPSTLSGYLTTSLIDPTQLAALVPLGNSAPPSHTYPVDHVYFTSPYGQDEAAIPKTPFFAPSDGMITAINMYTNYGQNNVVMQQSILVDYAICKGVLLKFGGVTELTPAVNTTLSSLQGVCNTQPPKHTGETSIKQCTYSSLSIQLKAGDQIGYTGAGGFPEVWAYDYRTTPAAGVDWQRYGYGDYAYAFCLFDMYSGDLKTALFNKFGSYNDRVTPHQFTARTAQPLCGTIHQNITGTIQGDWFAPGADPQKDNGPEFSGKALALIHSNFDPSRGRIVLAGTLMNFDSIEFVPTHSGLTNREFSEVTADGNTYCYTAAGGYGGTGKLLFQLVDDHHLNAEHQSGSCSSSEKFVNPIVYDR